MYLQQTKKVAAAIWIMHVKGINIMTRIEPINSFG
jgi:hypothetical protein